MTLQELIDNYGLEHIRDKTRISVDNILNLLNEDYDKCSITNALGFYKILEREFDIDFSQQKAKLKKSIDEHHYVPKELLVTERKYASTKKITSVALFLILLAAAAVGVVYYANDFSSAKKPQNDPNAANEQEQLALDTLKNVEKTPAKEQNASLQQERNTTQSEQNTTQNEQNATQLQKVIQEVQAEQKELPGDQNRSKTQAMSLPQEEQNATQNAEVLQTYTVKKPLAVEPKKKVWLGYIDLDSGKRVQKNKTQVIAIEGNNTLIVTGHGHLRIADIEFNTGQRLFFHYEGQKLQRLNEAAFRQQNEGRLW